MDDRARFAEWVGRYVGAWNTNDPADIGALFSEDAVYLTGPFDTPWRGREEIVRLWLERKDEPGTTRFEYTVRAVDGDLGVIEGVARYLDPPRTFGNLWLVELQGSECSSFTEYWMEEP